MNYLSIKYIKTVCLVSMISLLACRKYVQVDPPTTNPAGNSVYEGDAKAAAVLTSIYSKMAASSSPGFAEGKSSLTVYLGLAADELQAYTASGAIYLYFYQNLNTAALNTHWSEFYNYIYIANAAIEGLSASSGVSAGVKNQLIGEAKFIRAFCYFYLVNVYGDVPLILTTDYATNATASRTPKEDIYHQMIQDLTDAKGLLPTGFVTPIGASTTERVRPIKSAATALLARVYLYHKEWANAESQATEVINDGKFTLGTLSNAFLKNNNEAIWQLQPVVTGYCSYDGNTFIRTTVPNSIEPTALRPAFLSNFESGDQRRLKWVDSITIGNPATKYYYPAKYRTKGSGSNTVINEYHVVLRLAEQYLIRAEARAQLNKVGESQADLNVIRTRAGLPNTTANDPASLLTAILHERQIEFFAEWAHRWFDLKRTNTIDAVMNVVCPLKGGTWDTRMQLIQIPASEILADPNLTQNPGY